MRHITYTFAARHLFLRSVTCKPRHLSSQFVRLRCDSATPEASPAPLQCFDESSSIRPLRHDDVLGFIKNLDSRSQSSESLVLLTSLNQVLDATPDDIIQLAENLLEALRKQGTTITEDHYVGLLECYLRNKKAVSLESLSPSMNDDGVEPTKRIVDLLIRCQLEGTKPNEALAVAENLNKEKIDDEAVYSSIIYSYGLAGNLEKAKEEFNAMRDRNIKPQGETYTSLLKVAALAGDSNYMDTLWADILKENINLSEEQILSVLETFGQKKMFHQLVTIQTCCQCNIQNIILKLLVKSIYKGEAEDAYRWLEVVFKNMKLFEKDNLFNPHELHKCFVNELVKNNHPISDLIVKTNSLRCFGCEYIMENVLYCCLKNDDMQEAVNVLKFMCDNELNVEPHYYWPLIVNADKKFGPDGIFRVLLLMIKSNILYDVDTLKCYVFPRIEPEFAIMLASKVPKTSWSFRLFNELFLSYSLENGRYSAAVNYLETYPLFEGIECSFLGKACLVGVKKFPLTTEAWKFLTKLDLCSPSDLLGAAWSARRDPKEIELSLKFLEEKNVSVTRSSRLLQMIVHPNLTEKLKAKLLALPVAKESEKTKQPVLQARQSACEELKETEEREIHVAELAAKQMDQVHAQFRLFQMYMMTNNIKKAAQKRKELAALQVNSEKITSGVTSYLFKLAVNQGNLEEATRLYKGMREKTPSFLIDIDKALTYGQLLFQNGRVDEGLAVLQQVSTWKGSGHINHKLAAQYLQAALQVCQREQLEKLLGLLSSLDNFRMNKATLHRIELGKRKADPAYRMFEQMPKSMIYLLSPEFVLRLLNEDRMDIVNKVISLLASLRPQSEVALFSAVYIVAMRGKVDQVVANAKEHGIRLNPNKTRTFLGSPKENVVGLKTLIAAAAELGTFDDEMVTSVLPILTEVDNGDVSRYLLEMCRTVPMKEETMNAVSRMKALCETIPLP